MNFTPSCATSAETSFGRPIPPIRFGWLIPESGWTPEDREIFLGHPKWLSDCLAGTWGHATPDDKDFDVLPLDFAAGLPLWCKLPHQRSSFRPPRSGRVLIRERKLRRPRLKRNTATKIERGKLSRPANWSVLSSRRGRLKHVVDINSENSHVRRTIHR